jgi:hypothetical protein
MFSLDHSLGCSAGAGIAKLKEAYSVQYLKEISAERQV